MFYHVFDKQDKIREIYFLRQLQHDEAEKKVLARWMLQCECGLLPGRGCHCLSRALLEPDVMPIWNLPCSVGLPTPLLAAANLFSCACACGNKPCGNNPCACACGNKPCGNKPCALGDDLKGGVPCCVLQLQHVPDIKSLGISPEHYKGSGDAKPSEERAQKHEHYASLYNQARAPSDVL